MLLSFRMGIVEALGSLGAEINRRTDLVAQRSEEIVQQESEISAALKDLRADTETLLAEHGANRRLVGIESSVMAMVASRVSRTSSEESVTRKKIDIVLAPDSTRGETAPISVSIKTVGGLLPVTAPRIDIKVNDGTIRKPFGEHKGKYLPDSKTLGLDRSGKATVRYDNILGESLEDSRLVSLGEAKSYQEIVRRVRERFTPSQAKT